MRNLLDVFRGIRLSRKFEFVRIAQRYSIELGVVRRFLEEIKVF